MLQDYLIIIILGAKVFNLVLECQFFNTSKGLFISYGLERVSKLGGSLLFSALLGGGSLSLGYLWGEGLYL